MSLRDWSKCVEPDPPVHLRTLCTCTDIGPNALNRICQYTSVPYVPVRISTVLCTVEGSPSLHEKGSERRRNNWMFLDYTSEDELNVSPQRKSTLPTPVFQRVLFRGTPKKIRPFELIAGGSSPLDPPFASIPLSLMKSPPPCYVQVVPKTFFFLTKMESVFTLGVGRMPSPAQRRQAAGGIAVASACPSKARSTDGTNGNDGNGGGYLRDVSYC